MGKRGWNHNVHYHRLLLEAMPEPCERALDVGCGEGTLARALAGSAGEVMAIDVDTRSVEIARELDRESPSGVHYLIGDFQTFPFAPASFDLVACVAALHHMDEERALGRMAELLRPGGTLAVLGVARSNYPGDLPRDVLATIVNQVKRLARGYWEPPVAVLPPHHTYREMRRLAERALPRARFQRHLLWRYSIVWTKSET